MGYSDLKKTFDVANKTTKFEFIKDTTKTTQTALEIRIPDSLKDTIKNDNGTISVTNRNVSVDLQKSVDGKSMIVNVSDK